MSVSRDPIRKAFAALLNTALVGSGKPVEAVYDYQIGDISTYNPVVMVYSGPIQRRRVYGCEDVDITLYADVYVLYADSTSGWTKADAEDAIDAIESAIAAVVADPNHTLNQSGHSISYAEEPTRMEGVEIGGVEYCREVISITVQVRGQ